MADVDQAISKLEDAKKNASEVGSKQIDETIKMLQGYTKQPGPV